MKVIQPATSGSRDLSFRRPRAPGAPIIIAPTAIVLLAAATTVPRWKGHEHHTHYLQSNRTVNYSLLRLAIHGQ
jgi:hypothetical protein